MDQSLLTIIEVYSQFIIAKTRIQTILITLAVIFTIIAFLNNFLAFKS